MTGLQRAVAESKECHAGLAAAVGRREEALSRLRHQHKHDPRAFADAEAALPHIQLPAAVVCHFVGAAPGSDNLRLILRRLVLELR